jgi:hypothetical protein
VSIGKVPSAVIEEASCINTVILNVAVVSHKIFDKVFFGEGLEFHLRINGGGGHH